MENQLSICIPTFNRGSQLKKCIDSFFKEAIQAKVHIIVSDNGSTDETPKIVDAYLDYEHFYYFRHDTNKGADLNMLFAISSSKTEFNWWMGDDDVLEPNAIKTVLAMIDKGFDFILLNSFVKGAKGKNLALRINIKENEIYNSHLDFYYKYHFHMSFGCLILRKLPEKYNNSFEEYIGSLHAYVIYALTSILASYKKDDIKILVCSSPLMTWNGGDKEYFAGIYELYYSKMLSMRKRLPNGYAPVGNDVIQNYLAKVTSIKFLCMVKRLSPFQLLPFKEAYQLSRFFSAKQKLKFYAISCFIPRVLMRLIFHIYKFVRS